MSKIGIFDSGIGGLTILEKLKELMPNEEYLFYEDSINNPYGEKSDDELKAIVSNIVEYLIRNECMIIVIACNTATTRCISYLREKYKSIIFIGTEPAIKVACDRNYSNILVMATPATINSERIDCLVTDNKKNNENVYLVSCDGLANAIENNDVIKQKKIISQIYNKYQKYDIDAIVLGCTHYPLIKDLIATYFKGAQLLDGSSGVARECQRQLELHNLANLNKNGKVMIVNSRNG